ncbi:MAG: hypothetical protein ACRYGG_03730 [Janthinobacterium lividum]
MSVADTPLQRPVTAACGQCRHLNRERRAVESALPGMIALGSAFGASLADSLLCQRHDCLVRPTDRCAGFEAV